MTVFNDWENPTYPGERFMSIIQFENVSVIVHFAYKTGCQCRRLQLQPVESRGPLDSWLWEHRFSKTASRVEQSMNAPPHVHVVVFDGSQYAALAKCVNGAKVSISAELSGVIA